MDPHKKTEPGPLPSITFFTSVKSKMATKKNTNKNYSVQGVGGAAAGGGYRGGGPYKKMGVNFLFFFTLCKG